MRANKWDWERCSDKDPWVSLAVKPVIQNRLKT